MYNGCSQKQPLDIQSDLHVLAGKNLRINFNCLYRVLAREITSSHFEHFFRLLLPPALYRSGEEQVLLPWSPRAGQGVACSAGIINDQRQPDSSYAR